MGLRAVASGSSSVAVSQLIAGTGITISPTSGVGSVTVSNAGVLSLVSGSSLIVLSASTGAISLSVSSTIVVNTRAINTSGSLTGGGDLTADRTISLVNDNATPGNSKYYGTDSGGTKGYFDVPTGNPGTVTSIAAGTGLTTGSTAPITSTGTISLSNTTVTAGTYGTAASVATFTVNDQGQLTAATNMAIAIDTSQITSGTLVMARLGLSASSGGIVYGTATNLGITAAGASGQLLQSQGTAAPIWTTATYPTTAANAGRFLASDGTNVVNSAYAIPTAIGTLGTFLRSNGTDIVASVYILPASLTINGLLYANATGSVSQVTVVNSGALVTDSSGVPSVTASSSGTVLRSSDGSAVAFGKVDLSTDVTGTLPAGNGGGDPLFGWMQYI